MLTRDIPIGTRRFREDMQRERGLSADDTERMLQAAETDPALQPFLESRGEELAVGIERAAAARPTTTGSWLDFLRGLIPANILGLGASTKIVDGAATTALSFNVLQLIVIAIAVGAESVTAVPLRSYRGEGSTAVEI